MAQTNEQRAATHAKATPSPYCALPLRVPERFNAVFYLYIKPMLVATDAEQVQGGEGVAINGQTQTTLFFTGLPTGMDQQNVASLFEQFGNVSSVVLHHNKLSGVVEFDNASYIKDVLTAARAGEECVVSLADDGGTASRGIKALVEAHKHCYRPKGGNEALATHLNEHIIKLEAEAKQREQEALRAQADDGWTVVVRGKGRNKGLSGVSVRGAGVSKTAAAQAAATRKTTVVVEDFYRFQKKEKARNELLELRQKFEEDKRRIQQLKAQRKFKPC